MRYLLMCALCVCTVGCASYQGTKQQNETHLPKIHFYGGPGDSYETAVQIDGASSQVKGMEAEYFYITGKLGKKDKDWRLVGQTMDREKSHVYDVLEVEVVKTSLHSFYYFNITQCSWAPKKNPHESD
jgi:hypothetical protein